MNTPLGNLDVARMETAFGERYRIDKVIGSGAAATVFGAKDLHLGRDVAIKVLNPDVAASLGRERFVREIKVTVGLTHPNILPVFDAGEADGLLFYTMPLVLGETLRHRLEDDGALPVAEAVRIAQQIAAALDCAHEQGVIHRDIKPENVLLPSGEVLVADFGIAKAMERADEPRLTRTGVAVGTPLYMSPEQATGIPLDERSDLYSLGCLLYEMLTGSPPFLNQSAAVVMARHMNDTAARVRESTREVSRGLESVVERALAKDPDQRFQSAKEMSLALEEQKLPLTNLLKRPWMGYVLLAVWIIGVAGILVVGGRWIIETWRPVLDPDRIVVLPFAVTGTPQTDLSSELRLLLPTGFTGEGGPQAVDFASAEDVLGELVEDPTLPVTDETVRRIARRLDAGLILRGTVHANRDDLTLSAEILDASTGGTIADVQNVQGLATQLQTVVDRITVEFLVRLSHEPNRRLETLIGSTPAGARAYLEGRGLYKVGRYRDALRYLTRAHEADSALTLASMAICQAGRRLRDDRVQASCIEDAANAAPPKGHLDSLHFSAYSGRDYPSHAYPASQELSRWEIVAPGDQDNPDSWVELGWIRFNIGRVVGRRMDSGDLTSAFHRALDVDSLHIPAMESLIDVKVSLQDTVGLGALWSRYLRVTDRADRADYLRLRVHGLSDPSLGANVDPVVLDSLEIEEIMEFIGRTQIDGLEMELAQRALIHLERRRLEDNEPAMLRNLASDMALNRGRSGDEEPYRRSLDRPRATDLLARVLNSLYWEADTLGVSSAIDFLDTLISDPDSGIPPQVSQPFHCPVGLWRVSQGRYPEARHSVRELDLLNNPFHAPSTTHLPLCARMIQAQIDEAEGLDEESVSLEELEALSRQAYPGFGHLWAASNLAAADIHQSRGDPEGALQALERRYYDWAYGTLFLSTFLLKEGRVAASLGYPDQAIRAFEHYLVLRSDPEEGPASSEREEVRAALERIRATDGLF